MNTRKLIITVDTADSPIDNDVFRDILTLFKDYPINTAHSPSAPLEESLENNLRITYRFIHFNSPTSFETVIFYKQDLNAIKANIDLQARIEFTLDDYKHMGGYGCWRVSGKATAELVDKHFLSWTTAI